jgi:Fe-S-cluster containining protein
MNCSGLCCATYAVIPLRAGEANRIAEYLEIPIDEFRENYIQPWRKEAHYESARNGDMLAESFKISPACAFWTTGLCGIHEVKPLTCKLFAPACVAHSWLEREECVQKHKDRLKRQEHYLNVNILRDYYGKGN